MYFAAVQYSVHLHKYIWYSVLYGCFVVVFLLNNVLSDAHVADTETSCLKRELGARTDPRTNTNKHYLLD